MHDGKLEFQVPNERIGEDEKKRTWSSRVGALELHPPCGAAVLHVTMAIVDSYVV
jgi:hypothetical protein